MSRTQPKIMEPEFSANETRIAAALGGLIDAHPEWTNAEYAAELLRLGVADVDGRRVSSLRNKMGKGWCGTMGLGEAYTREQLRQAWDDGYRAGLAASGGVPAPAGPSGASRSREALRSVAEVGTAEEQAETFAYMVQAVEADRLSDRLRFR